MEDQFQQIYEQQCEIYGFDPTYKDLQTYMRLQLRELLHETKQSIEDMTLNDMVMLGLLIIPGCSYATQATRLTKMAGACLFASAKTTPPIAGLLEKPQASSQVPASFQPFYKMFRTGPVEKRTGEAQVHFWRGTRDNTLNVDVFSMRGFHPHTGEKLAYKTVDGGSRWVLRDVMRQVESEALRMGCADFYLRTHIINEKLYETIARHTTQIDPTTFLVRLKIAPNTVAQWNKIANKKQQFWSDRLDPLPDTIYIPKTLPATTIASLKKPITRKVALRGGGEARYTLSRTQEGHLMVDVKYVRALDPKTEQMTKTYCDVQTASHNLAQLSKLITQEAKLLGTEEYILRGILYSNELCSHKRLHDILARKALHIGQEQVSIKQWPHAALANLYLFRPKLYTTIPAGISVLQSIASFAASTDSLKMVASVGAAIARYDPLSVQINFTTQQSCLRIPATTPTLMLPTPAEKICERFNQGKTGTTPTPPVLTPLQERMKDVKPVVQRTINIATVSEVKNVFPIQGNVYRGADGNIFAIDRANNTVSWVQGDPPQDIQIPNWWEICVPDNLTRVGPAPFITNAQNMPPTPPVSTGRRIHPESGLEEIPGVKFIGRCGQQHNHNGRNWNIGMPCDVCKGNPLIPRGCASWVTVFL